MVQVIRVASLCVAHLSEKCDVVLKGALTSSCASMAKPN
jgi:hypothetical protein